MNLRPVKALLRKKYSNEGTCPHCGLPWSCCNIHHVSINEREGFFAVCEDCYEKMTDMELMAAYQNLWHVGWPVPKPFRYIVFRNAYMKDIKSRHNDA